MGLPKLNNPNSKTKVKPATEEVMLILLSSVTDQLQLKLLAHKLSKLREEQPPKAYILTPGDKDHHGSFKDRV